ncbi:hypothetical protein AAG906_017015 [Vitis piasezkii]
MSDLIKAAWRNYLLQLQLHPLRTKAITAGVLVGCSDVIAQKISGIKRLQLRRLILMMLYGFAYSGPFGHFLHKLMDIIFRERRTIQQLLKRKRMGVSEEQSSKDYPSVQLTAWKFWPIVGWVNYQYMPLQFRVVFHSFVASCWAIFLNLKARSVAIKKA